MTRHLTSNALITFCSRILGFGRDILVARYLGASWQLDAFLWAFKLPNFFRRLLAEGAFSQSLIPAVMRAENPDTLLADIYGLLLLVTIGVSIPFMLYPETMIQWLAVGLDSTSPGYHMSILMLPLVFTYLTAMVCCGFYTAQLNIKEAYYVGSLLPIILNICLIVGVVGYKSSQDIFCMAYAVFVAGILQVIASLYATYYYQGVVKPNYLRLTPGVMKVLKQVGMAFSAQVIMYGSSMLDLVLVSFLPVGSLSWLYYAERLAYLPIGVFSVVLANIVLPKLSKAAAGGDKQDMIALFDSATGITLTLAFPLMIGGCLCAYDIIYLLFGSEVFQISDVMASGQSLQILLIALPAMMLNRVWMTGPYAFSDTRYQIKVALLSSSGGIVVAVIGLPHLAHVAISLGGMVSACIGCYLFYQYIHSHTGYRIGSNPLIYRSGIASLCMGCMLLPLVIFDIGYLSKSMTASWLCIKIAWGMGCYFLIMRLMGVRLSMVLP